MSHRVKCVAVVGFGAAGAAAAIELQRQGFSVTLFERASKIGPVGAGILIHPSGQSVLSKLDLLSEIASRSERIEKISIRNQSKHLLDIRYDEQVEGRIAYGVERSLLFESLEKKVAAVGVNLQLGLEIMDLQNNSNATVCCISSSRKQYGPYDLVLIADGARSTLRPKFMPRAWLWNYSRGARWVIGKCQAVQGELRQVVHGTKHLIGVLPMGNNRASFFWGLIPEEDKTDFNKWRTKALSLCPFAEEILAPLHSFHQMIETNYAHLFMGYSAYKTIIPLGDAWHAMSPHLGQGTNLALMDGYIFAKMLGRYNGELEVATKHFLAVRRANNCFYSIASFCCSPFFQSDGLLKGYLRDALLPNFAKMPWIRRHMVSSISGLKTQFLGHRECSI